MLIVVCHLVNICLSFIDLCLLITPWYLLSIVLSVFRVNQWRTDKTMDKRYQGVIRRRKSMKDWQNNGQKIPRGNKKASIVLSVLHWFKPSYYPLVSFVLCFVCPSLIYAFLLPLGIFCPLFCLSFIDLSLLITPWWQNNGQKIPRGNKKT
jgi:hypothetical protein